MPIYENRENAENRITLPESSLRSIISGNAETIAAAAKKIEERHASAVLIDGWYTPDIGTFSEGLEKELKARGLRCVRIPACRFFRTGAELAHLKQPWITEDPSFGKVDSEGSFKDFIDPAGFAAAKAEIGKAAKTAKTVVFVEGPGAALVQPDFPDSMLFYMDCTADPMLWRMWRKELVPFDSAVPRDYGWKEYYYCDFYVLYAHKRDIFRRIDFYSDSSDLKCRKLMPGSVVRDIFARLVKQPVKQVRTYSPGPWGAYRYRDLWKIPGLENNAWNRLAGADLSMLIQPKEGLLLNLPSVTMLIEHAAEFAGNFAANAYPGLIPVEIWLDDGYFPKPEPYERTSMPIHNHPGTGYVQRHFNEPLGRYETYYIVEAYENASTHMGFKEEACLEEWERLCRESWKDKKPIPNWRDFIATHKTNVGDLFLIPEGTTHGHGGNQMVLEMDTCGNAAGGEYSFFGYDYMRPTWDDNAKSMTGKPMNMHLERYFEIDKGCRESYVTKHLRARPVVCRWTRDFSMDRYTTLPQMPFEIERLHFMKRAEYSTSGKFLQALTLTVGTHVTIRSKSDPELCTGIDRLQCALVPASFGDYEIVNSDGGASTVVLWHLKQG